MQRRTTIGTAKMAPTRLRCLNASRHISKTGSSLKAAFSTTRIACTSSSSSNDCSVYRLTPPDDSPSRSSATADLLASLGESPPKPQSSPNLYTNPIRAPSRQTSIFSSKPPSPSPGNSTANTRLMNLMRQQAAKRERAEATSQPGTRTNTLEELQKHKMAADLSKQITRRWKAGDVYAPHDLSAAEMGKWKNRSRPLYDVFDVLDFNPLDHYRVCLCSIIFSFCCLLLYWFWVWESGLILFGRISQ
jgi:small subunit ribosomal protein S18